MLSAYLLLRFAPFKRWQKVLFLLGYFPLYEYGVISRSYSLDMLGLFGFCAVYGWAKRQNRTPWLGWLFLLLIATNESFGLLMALPLAGLLIADLCAQRKMTRQTWSWIGGFLASSGVLLAYFLWHLLVVVQWRGLFRRTPDNLQDGFEAFTRVLGRAVFPKICVQIDAW